MVAHPSSSTINCSTHTAQRWEPNYETPLSHEHKRRRRSLGDATAVEDEDHHHSIEPMGHRSNRRPSMDLMPSQPMRSRSPVHHRTQRRNSMPKMNGCCWSQQILERMEDGTKEGKDYDNHHYDTACCATIDYAPGLPPKRLPSLRQHTPCLLTDDDQGAGNDDDAGDDDDISIFSYPEEEESPTMLTSVAGGAGSCPESYESTTSIAGGAGSCPESYESTTSITFDYGLFSYSTLASPRGGSFIVDLAPPAIPIRTQTPDQNKKTIDTCTKMKRKKQPPLPDSFFSPAFKTNAKKIQKESTPTAPSDAAADRVELFAGGDSSAESFFGELYSPEQKKSTKFVPSLPDVSKYGYCDAKPDVADRNNQNNNESHRHSYRSSSIDLSALPSAMKKGGKKHLQNHIKDDNNCFSRRVLSFDTDIKVHEVSPIAKDVKNELWFQKNEKKIIKKNVYKAVQGVQSGWMDRSNHGGIYNSSCNGATDLRGIEGYMADVARRRDKTMDDLYDLVLDAQSIQRQSQCHDDVQLASFSKQISEESRRLAIERALHDAIIAGTHTKMMTTTVPATNNIQEYPPLDGGLCSNLLQRRNSMF